MTSPAMCRPLSQIERRQTCAPRRGSWGVKSKEKNTVFIKRPRKRPPTRYTSDRDNYPRVFAYEVSHPQNEDENTSGTDGQTRPAPAPQKATPGEPLDSNFNPIPRPRHTHRYPALAAPGIKARGGVPSVRSYRDQHSYWIGLKRRVSPKASGDLYIADC